MYKSESTPSDDPLAVEVFLPLNDRPSPYLDDDQMKQLNAAAALCRQHRALSAEFIRLSAEFIRLSAQVGVKICKQATSLEDASGNMASCLCWVRRDDREWFDGRLHSAIDLAGYWIPPEQVGIGGYLGRLTLDIRKWLYVAPGFAPFWMARQRMAERLGAPLSEYEGHLSAIVRQPAGPKVAHNILPIPPVDELTSRILELSPAFGVRYYGPDPKISLDPGPNEEKFKKPVQEECEFLMAQAGILTGAPDPKDPEGARTFLFNQLRAPGQLWLLDLRLAATDLLKRLKNMNALSRLPEPAPPPPAPGDRRRKRSRPPARGTPPPVLRPGHAAEVEQYKVKKGFTTDAEAARALGVSPDVLKSIKSRRGRLRCSQETEVAVLGKIAKALKTP
jgi:hypothetical protein